MKLQLYINDQLFCETILPVEDFMKMDDLSWEENVSYREEMLEGHISAMKGLYWRKIAKALTWQIIPVADSRINELEEKIYEKVNLRC